MDDNGHYFRVKPYKIKNREMVEEAPAYDPREEDESKWKEHGFEDKNSALYEKKYRGEEEEEYEGDEPGEEMFQKSRCKSVQ